MKLFVLCYFSAVAVFSLIAFAAYGFDKRRAKQGGRRVPEKTLHTIAFLGGWPGAYIAQNAFRHKTQKTSFRVVFWLITVLHIGLLIGILYAISTLSK